jgi:A/G-specific adenine glycosylase
MMPQDPNKGAADRLGGAAAMRDLQRSLGDWYRTGARDYPWRRTRDPYAILVSELMLQQTQIATVLGRGYYDRWMRALPDWASLAGAEEEAILKLWEGLGYYNRARNLQRTARIVMQEHGGRFPETPGEALALPGIGRYTVGAVLSFAYGLALPLVDGNVGRVLSRLLALDVAINSPGGLKILWEWAGELLDHDDPATHNSALMELGQRICRPSQPECPACPLRGHCLAHRDALTEVLPVKTKAASVTRKAERVILASRGGRILLCPESGSRRQGLWRLPEIAAETAADLPELFRFEYTITRYRVTLLVHEAPAILRPGTPPEGEGSWFPLLPPADLPPLGAPYRRALDLYADLRDDLDLRG